MLKKIIFLFLIYTIPVQLILADGIIKEQTISTSQGKTLNVKADCGDVIISTWNKTDAYIKISGNDIAKDKMTFNIEEKNGDIYVIAKKSSGTDELKNASLKIEVNIPDKFNTDIATAGGDINLGNLTGSINIKTAGGDIVLNNINGNASLKTAGGDIKVETITGNLSAKTAGGDISISGNNGSIKAKTAGGDVTVRYTGDNQGLDLGTTGGNINLYLPDNFSAKVELATMNGEIKSDFSLSDNTSKTAKQKISGIIGSGGELVSCKTMGGNITLEKIK